MSYRFEPLAPAAARYSGSRTTRAAGCASSSAWMAASSPPAPGAASRGTRKHSRSRSASWSGSTPLAGGDGLDPADRGPLPAFAQEDQHRAGGGAGEVVQPGPPGGDRDGQVEGGPGLAGLLLGGQHPVGVGRPEALDEPAGLPGRGDPGRDLPVGADGQLGRGQGRAAGPAGGWAEVDDLPAGGLLERAGGQGDAVAVLVVAGHAAPSRRRRRGLAAPPRSPDSIVARALASGLPASRAAASSTARTWSALQEPGGDQLAEVERGPVQGGVAAAGRGGRRPRPAPGPAPPARSRPSGRRVWGLGGGWSAPPAVGPAAAAARPGPRAASPSGAGPRGSGGRWRAGRVGPRSARPGPASPPRAAARPGCPARWGRTADASLPRRCAPPAPGARSGAIDKTARSASTPWSPSRSSTSKRRPVTRPRLAWGQRRHHSPTTAGSVEASRFQPASRGCLPGSEQAGSGQLQPPPGRAVCIGTTGNPRAAYTGAARAQPSSPRAASRSPGPSRAGRSLARRLADRAGSRLRSVTGRPSGARRSPAGRRSSRPGSAGHSAPTPPCPGRAGCR